MKRRRKSRSNSINAGGCDRGPRSLTAARGSADPRNGKVCHRRSARPPALISMQFFSFSAPKQNRAAGPLARRCQQQRASGGVAYLGCHFASHRSLSYDLFPNFVLRHHGSRMSHGLLLSSGRTTDKWAARRYAALAGSAAAAAAAALSIPPSSNQTIEAANSADSGLRAMRECACCISSGLV